MLTDALAQYLVWKRWTDWFLIEGSHPEDQALAEAYRRAAAKFGARDRRGAGLRGHRRGAAVGFGHGAGAGADAGLHPARARARRGGRGRPRPTSSPRTCPITPGTRGRSTGSAGLVPESWHPAHEAWGATQFQTRFEKQAGRPARDEDYQVWMALRVLGRGGDADTGRRLHRDPRLRAVGRLRSRGLQGPEAHLPRLGRPAAAADPAHHRRVVVSVSPQAEFLHQVSQLDTLGIDRPETTCKQ